MSLAHTLGICALCCYNTFGVGFFFLSNAFYYAASCSETPSVSAAGSMLFLVLVGMITGVVSIAGTFSLFKDTIQRNTSVRMMCTGTFYCMYTTLAFHLILSSLDPRFAVMGAMVLCGFTLSMRYDVADSLIGWGISGVGGAIVMIVEHVYAKPHAMNVVADCTATTATAGLIAGGIWAAIPATFSICYVIQFMPDTPAAPNNSHNKPADTLTPVITASVVSSVLHIAPIVAQAFNALDAWAPMLLTSTHARIIENIDSRPLTLFAIIAQSLLILASVGPVMWLLMSEVMAQARLRSSDSAMWLVTVVLIAAWSLVLMYADFAAIVWVYIASAAITALMAPFAAMMHGLVEEY